MIRTWRYNGETKMIKITTKKEIVDAEVKLVYEGESKEFNGKFQKIKFCGPVMVGLGKKQDFDEEKLKQKARKIAERYYRAFKSEIEKSL